MNFFDHQDKARRSSVLLNLLLVLAVVAIIGVIDISIAAVLTLFNNLNSATSFDGTFSMLPIRTHLWIAATVIGVVVVANRYRSNQLRDGGVAIAWSLGGNLISRASVDPHERRVLNVVEEMALASGTPVPPVYLLEDMAINAFAAGYTQYDAVICLTRGAMEILNRDELQGVIAHEFSHILHGDMRLNIRLVGVVYGIMFVSLAGSRLMHLPVRYRMTDVAAIPFVLGIWLFLLGLIGAIFGNMIKAAINRQREYLADASAVQYTRNPEGIGGALQKIAGWPIGSCLGLMNSSEYSHLYIADGVSPFQRGFFPTHPPLSDRIRRILPRWDGVLPKVKRPESAFAQPRSQQRSVAAAEIASVALLGDVLNDIGRPDDRHLNNARYLYQQLPKKLVAATEDSIAAYALSLGLVMPRNAGEWKDLLTTLTPNTHVAVVDTLKDLLPELAVLNIKLRLPLIELCIPSLKQLSDRNKQQFEADLKLIINSDQRIQLWEWTLYKLFALSLWQPVRSSMAGYDLKQLSSECRLLLAVTACYSKKDTQAAYTAGAERAGIAGQMPDLTGLQYSRISESLDRLARLKPFEQKTLLEAICRVVEFDGVVEAKEVELVRLVSICLGCPMPPLVFE